MSRVDVGRGQPLIDLAALRQHPPRTTVFIPLELNGNKIAHDARPSTLPKPHGVVPSASLRRCWLGAIAVTWAPTGDVVFMRFSFGSGKHQPHSDVS